MKVKGFTACWIACNSLFHTPWIEHSRAGTESQPWQWKCCPQTGNVERLLNSSVAPISAESCLGGIGLRWVSSMCRLLLNLNIFKMWCSGCTIQRRVKTRWTARAESSMGFASTRLHRGGRTKTIRLFLLWISEERSKSSISSWPYHKWSEQQLRTKSDLTKVSYLYDLLTTSSTPKI